MNIFARIYRAFISDYDELTTHTRIDYEEQAKQYEQNAMLMLDVQALEGGLEKYKLYDKFGVEITDRCVVHWTDGGDELSLKERIKERWDRIAVTHLRANAEFHVIDSPHNEVRIGKYIFHLWNFMYSDTEKYLTVVAENEAEYFVKFKSAGECMKWVLENE